MTTMKILGLSALLLVTGGCVGEDAAPQSAGMVVERPWSRAIPPGAPVAAGFMTLRNDGDIEDRLVAVRSDAAERVEIHEIRHEGGVARMREMEGGLPLPADSMVELKPGGYHLMFIVPGEGFVAGGRIDATLVFARAGERDIVLDVRGVAAGHGGGHEGH